MSKKSRIITVVLVLIIIISAILGIVFYNKEHNVNIKEENQIEKEISIEDFKNKLEDAGIVIEAESKNEANEKIGAMDGVTYLIDGKPIQVYVFDENSTDELTVSNLKKAKEEGKVVMPSFDNYEFKVLYNNGLIIVNLDDNSQKEKIEEIFNSL